MTVPTWFAEYCKTANELYDKWLLLVGNLENENDIVCAAWNTFRQHVDGCQDCRSEKAK